LLFGAAIGAERQWRQRTAGLRATLLGQRFQDQALERIVSRLSLEPGVK
jgi:hypothetical protein